MAKAPERRSYVFFANRTAQDTYCAVPTSDPIPDFLLDGGWRFVGVFHGGKPRLYYFREKRAQAAIERRGYYIFTAPSARSLSDHALRMDDSPAAAETECDLPQGTSADRVTKP